MYRNSLLYVIEMLRDICEMCYICVWRQGIHLQDICEIEKGICEIYMRLRKVYVMYFGILARIGKRTLGRTRRSKPQEMAGDSRGNYGGRFAGKLWREIRGEIMAGDSLVDYGARFAGKLWWDF
jgi:hypothetical protein